MKIGQEQDEIIENQVLFFFIEIGPRLDPAAIAFLFWFPPNILSSIDIVIIEIDMWCCYLCFLFFREEDSYTLFYDFWVTFGSCQFFNRTKNYVTIVMLVYTFTVFQRGKQLCNFLWLLSNFGSFQFFSRTKRLCDNYKIKSKIHKISTLAMLFVFSMLFNVFW